MTTKEIWDFGENIAVSYLEKNNYKIRERNYKIYGGEIDIIAEKSGIIYFIEVRFRKNDLYWHPLETLSKHKAQAFARAIFSYLDEHNLDEENIQIDFIGITKNPKKDSNNYRLSHLKGIDLEF